MDVHTLNSKRPSLKYPITAVNRIMIKATANNPPLELGHIGRCLKGFRDLGFVGNKKTCHDLRYANREINFGSASPKLRTPQ